MPKKLSLIVLGGSNSTLRRYCISHWQLVAITAGLLVTFLAVGFGLFQYVSHQSRLTQIQGVAHRLRHQTAELELQRRQIQQFAEEIDGLKQQLLTLNHLEAEIRTIANIDPLGHSDDMFGVGGSIPEDFSEDVEPSGDTQRLTSDMHRQVKQADDVHRNQHTSFETILARLKEEKNLLAHTPSIRPAAGVTASGFGYRKSPFSDALEFHKGIDIANLEGAPVMATADGMVSFVGLKGTFGRIMVIDHGFGITTRYAHIDKDLKKPGDMVRRGDQIALMGNSGTNLYYEVRLHGVPVNPDKFIAD